MAFIKLTSENPMMSYVLQKNPATQAEAGAPFTKNSKLYKNMLWFETENHVSLFSKFLNERKSKSENLDFKQHTKGEVYLQLVDHMLRTALIANSEHDTHSATLEFTVYNHSELDYAERIPEYVTSCETIYKHSKIVIVAPTIKKALEVCCIISLLTAFYEPDYYIEDAQFLKYFAFVVETTSEYSLLRQCISFVKSQSLYKKAALLLESTPFIIRLPRAFDARRNFYINELVSKTDVKELLELGCGEGAYFKAHTKHYTTVNSIEPDADVFNEATHARRKIKAEEVITLHNTDAMSYLETVESLSGIDVLLTEVLEHIDYDESMAIIDKVLSLNPNKFLITLPNHEFNTYYGYAPGEFRHDDHLWEPTIEQFTNIVDMLRSKLDDSYTLTDYYLGDCERANLKNCATFAILISK